jgi:hypothetical protein
MKHKRFLCVYGMYSLRYRSGEVKEPRKRPLGRPQLSRVRIQITLKPQIRDALAQTAQAENMTQSECVEEALTLWFKRRKR